MSVAHPVRAAFVALLVLAACRSSVTPPPGADLAEGGHAGFDAASIQHQGPGVMLARSGPGRFVGPLLEAFDAARALRTVELLDALHRTPGSPDFERGLDHLYVALQGAGFGREEGLELEWIEAELAAPSWAALSGRIALVDREGRERVLHEFQRSSDRDRAMLPIGSPAAQVEGPLCFELDQIHLGDVFVSESRLRRDLVSRAQARGAVAVVCGGLEPFNVDPTGAERHLDAVQLRTAPADLELPVAQVSPRSLELLRAAHVAGGARLRLTARSESGAPRARTLVARIRGAERADEAVVCVSQGGGPGAINNASGAAGLAEGAGAIAHLVREGVLPRPARTLVFVLGPEMAGSRAWLGHESRRVVAGVNLTMIGSSPTKTGAVALLERHPDPGARWTLPPDEHTSWGFRRPDASWLVPNGLAIVARCALADVALHVGGWRTGENPYEGGSDHEVLLGAGIPTVLFWHFTDFTFYTSLDRLEMVDGVELERTAVAGLATAWALADPRPTDLARYLATLDAERRIRLTAAQEAERPRLAGLWTRWFDGARMWLRAHCLGLELPPPVALADLEREG